MEISGSLEQEVATLLSLAGYAVKREMILGHKKVDLYFEERRLGSTRRVAVECKGYESRLTQTDVTTIYSNYLPLYRDNIIDEILIITLNGLTPSALTFIDETRELSHLTFEDVQRMIMDFRPYLFSLINQYSEDGLESCYVPVKTTNNEDLDVLVDDWLKQSSYQGLAILGSYGIGKTSFARHMSYLLAKRSLKESSQRIPILLRLGEISSEQSLEGLLGKAFTYTAVVRNYTFDTFMALNSRGRFLIFLDGFDEMKHTLSWEEFQYNFKQLNRLVNGGSKVILLGRPTAFLSEEEQRHALHGIRVISGTEFREPDWPDYQEIHLAPFDKYQVEEFLNKYLIYKHSTTNAVKVRRRIEKLLRSREEISSKQLSDIARRPVQLRMLAEVLPQWEGDVSELTISILYSVFIDLVVEREQDKIARRYFGTRERRRFARQLAWWLWNSKKEMSVKAEDIPVAILQDYRKGGMQDLESIRRDLVSACFLEKKAGGALYFPHRSFQEFLVAEEIADLLSAGKTSISEVDNILTEDVSRFLAGIANISELQSWELQMNKHRGIISLQLARVWLAEEKYGQHMYERLTLNDFPWYTLFLTVGICQDRFPRNLYGEMLMNVIIDKLKSVKEPLYALLSLFCLIILSVLMNGGASRKNSLTIGSALETLYLGKQDTTKRRTHRKLAAGHLKRPDELLLALLSCIKFVKKGASYIINLSDVYPFFRRHLEDYCLISDWVPIGHMIKIERVNLPLKIQTFGLKQFDVIHSLQTEFLGHSTLSDPEDR